MCSDKRWDFDIKDIKEDIINHGLIKMEINKNLHKDVGNIAFDYFDELTYFHVNDNESLPSEFLCSDVLHGVELDMENDSSHNDDCEDVDKHSHCNFDGCFPSVPQGHEVELYECTCIYCESEKRHR